MPEREKVKAELDEIVEQCRGMGYIGFSTITEHCKNILALLKEQEAVEPEISESYRTNSGRMSRRKAWCGACGIGINFDAKFCDHCGKAVKWE